MTCPPFIKLFGKIYVNKVAYTFIKTAMIIDFCSHRDSLNLVSCSSQQSEMFAQNFTYAFHVLDYRDYNFHSF